MFQNVCCAVLACVPACSHCVVLVCILLHCRACIQRSLRCACMRAVAVPCARTWGHCAVLHACCPCAALACMLSLRCACVHVVAVLCLHASCWSVAACMQSLCCACPSVFPAPAWASHPPSWDPPCTIERPPPMSSSGLLFQPLLHAIVGPLFLAPTLCHRATPHCSSLNCQRHVYVCQNWVSPQQLRSFHFDWIARDMHKKWINGEWPTWAVNCSCSVNSYRGVSNNNKRCFPKPFHNHWIARGICQTIWKWSVYQIYVLFVVLSICWAKCWECLRQFNEFMFSRSCSGPGIVNTFCAYVLKNVIHFVLVWGSMRHNLLAPFWHTSLCFSWFSASRWAVQTAISSDVAKCYIMLKQFSRHIMLGKTRGHSYFCRHLSNKNPRTHH